MVKLPMGSERKETENRQPEAEEAAWSRPAARERAPNACCFCWCCCCSCSCLTVQNGDGGEGEPSNIKIEEAANCEDSTELTVEEACSWGQSFDRMMSCPAGREAFRSFLRTEFSEENMLFWLACEDLKKETREGAIKEKVRTIYEDYISILSPKEVSLDSRVREMINRNMLEPSSCTFDDAQFQIYTLMQRDSYPRYMASPAYADLLQGLVEKGPRS
nr:regulator of G-protein signaling 20-like isoform X2 [Paramormyrops kingsleyae]